MKLKKYNSSKRPDTHEKTLFCKLTSLGCKRRRPQLSSPSVLLHAEEERSTDVRSQEDGKSFSFKKIERESHSKHTFDKYVSTSNLSVFLSFSSLER